MTMAKINSKQLYERVCAVTKETERSHWCSDFYFKKTKETEALVNRYTFKNTMVGEFVDNISHEVWYEVPFIYPHGMENPTA